MNEASSPLFCEYVVNPTMSTKTTATCLRSGSTGSPKINGPAAKSARRANHKTKTRRVAKRNTRRPVADPKQVSVDGTMDVVWVQSIGIRRFRNAKAQNSYLLKVKMRKSSQIRLLIVMACPTG